MLMWQNVTTSKTCKKKKTSAAKQILELNYLQSIILLLSNIQFGRPVETLKSMERILLALIKSSLFYGRLLMAGSFPGEL